MVYVYLLGGWDRKIAGEMTSVTPTRPDYFFAFFPFFIFFFGNVLVGFGLMWFGCVLFFLEGGACLK